MATTGNDLGATLGTASTNAPAPPQYDWVWDPSGNIWYDKNTYVTASGPPPGVGGQYTGPPDAPAADGSTRLWNPQVKGFVTKGSDGKLSGGYANPLDITDTRNTLGHAVQQRDVLEGRGTAVDALADADRQRQLDLADALKNTINDPNAPSVAREQLAQAEQANEATQASQAAGASGENAYLARTGAARNMAALNANAGQSAALLRAQEVAAAQNNLSNVLGAAATEDINRYGTDIGAANNLTATAVGGKQAGTAEADQNKIAKYTLGIEGGKVGATALGGGAAGGVKPTDTTPSDRRLKEDIEEEPDAKVMAFLSAITPKSFRFKGSMDDGEEHHGVIAQDLEKSDIGRSLVHDTPGGKMVDIGGGLGAALAALAHLHGRVEALEGKKRG